MSNWTVFKIFLFLCGPIGWAILILLILVVYVDKYYQIIMILMHFRFFHFWMLKQKIKLIKETMIDGLLNYLDTDKFAGNSPSAYMTAYTAVHAGAGLHALAAQREEYIHQR